MTGSTKSPDGEPGASPSGGSTERSTESRMNRIARRAHELYQARGSGDGAAVEDWLQAEREIDAELTGGDGTH